MATTFNVIYLGVFSDIDPSEGNSTIENAGNFLNQTFGGPDDPLWSHIQELSPGSVPYLGGDNVVRYDVDNDSHSESFRINGGDDQVFDSGFIYGDVTITYSNGTTAITSVHLFQDTEGHTYLAPHFSDLDGGQSILDAGPIESLTINATTLGSLNTSGMLGNRLVGFVPCFTSGALINTPTGYREIDTLEIGDLVSTRDNGAQSIRWIGSATHRCKDEMIPIRINKGALACNLPNRDLVVSQQHRMLVRSRIAERMFGASEVLVPAKKLLDIPGIELATELDTVTYIHFMLDNHEIVYAEGAETETLLCGPQAARALGPAAMKEIRQIFPNLDLENLHPARHMPRGKLMKQLVARHLKNKQPIIQF